MRLALLWPSVEGSEEMNAPQVAQQEAAQTRAVPHPAPSLK
jgi:hypothetical protein